MINIEALFRFEQKKSLSFNSVKKLSEEVMLIA